jgi:hypothetical protein
VTGVAGRREAAAAARATHRQIATEAQSMFPVGPELHTLPQFGFSVLFVAGSGVATVPYGHSNAHGRRGATSSSSATFVRPWSSKFLSLSAPPPAPLEGLL